MYIIKVKIVIGRGNFGENFDRLSGCSSEHNEIVTRNNSLGFLLWFEIQNHFIFNF